MRDFKRRTKIFREPKTMVDAKCSNCGRDCKLPFHPRQGKPVYCSECYEKLGNKDTFRPDRDNRREFRGRSNFAGRNDFNNKSSDNGMAEINKKLDRILELLTK